MTVPGFRTIAVLLSTTFLTSVATADTIVHVSTDGNDDNPGTTSQPLATMEGARLRVRQLNNGDEAITVVFAAGVYFMSEPVNFDAADSGSPSTPVGPSSTQVRSNWPRDPSHIRLPMIPG